MLGIKSQNQKTTKNSEQKEDEFVGRTFNNGTLTVVSVHGRLPAPSYIKTYNVFCSECAKDPDLYGDGVFIVTKGTLTRGSIPCGCSNSYSYSTEQVEVLGHRVAKSKGLIFHGILGKYTGSKSKLTFECKSHNHKWSTRMAHIFNSKSGCVYCASEVNAIKQRLPKEIATKRCIDFCSSRGYTFLKFTEEYKGVDTDIEYLCQEHGIQKTKYNTMVNSGKCCKLCAVEKRKDNGGVYGWYPSRSNEQDFLYVLNFNNEYIKVGRSFDVARRIPELKVLSSCDEVETIAVYTGTHKEVYEVEQEIHRELRERCFKIKPKNWNSLETFSIDCLHLLDKLLNTVYKETCVINNFNKGGRF